jgi:hypothetical protein
MLNNKTIILFLFIFFQLQAQNQYPKSVSPIIRESVKVQIGTQLKDLQVGYIESSSHMFFVVPLPYVDSFTENVLIKNGSTYEPIFNEDKKIDFPYRSEPIIKVEFKNVFADQSIESAVIAALKQKVPALANKEGRRLSLISSGRMKTFLEFNTPYGIYRAEGEVPFSSFTNSNFSAFIRCNDILEIFGNAVEGLSLSDVSMGIDISYTALFTKREFSMSAEFTEENLLSSLSEVSSAAGNEKLLFIPIGGSGSQKNELSNRLSDYMTIEVMTYKESSGTDSKSLTDNIVSDFISNSLKDFYEQVNLGNEDNATKINLLMSNGISLETTIGNIKSADFNIDKEKTYKELIEKGKAKSGSTGLTFAIPQKFSFGYNGAKSGSNTSKKETFKQEIEKIKQTFTGDIPVMTGISLSAIKNFQNAKSSDVYMTKHADAEEKQQTATIYLDFDTSSSCNNNDIKRIAYNVLNQSLRWAQGESFQIMNDLPKRIEYQSQVFDEQFFSSDLIQRMNNTDHQKLNQFKTNYQYLIAHGFVEDIRFKEKKDNGVNTDYIFEILFRNKENPVHLISAFPNGLIRTDFNGNPVYLYETHPNGQLIVDFNGRPTNPIKKTFNMLITITPDCKIETWGVGYE